MLEVTSGLVIDLWLLSSSLPSYHEKAAEALCLGRIQTLLGADFVSEFSGQTWGNYRTHVIDYDYNYS